MELISWEQFEQVEVRTGTIIDAQPFPKAKKPSYQLTIDFGPIGIKKSSAQITVHYALDTLLGRQIIAVVNFPPRQIANFFSECLVLGVYDGSGDVVLLKPDHPVENGCRMG
jgi:tRNA-binding protein